MKLSVKKVILFLFKIPVHRIKCDADLHSWLTFEYYRIKMTRNIIPIDHFFLSTFNHPRKDFLNILS